MSTNFVYQHRWYTAPEDVVVLTLQQARDLKEIGVPVRITFVPGKWQDDKRYNGATWGGVSENGVLFVLTEGVD